MDIGDVRRPCRKRGVGTGSCDDRWIGGAGGLGLQNH
jgi:hypothetical protein